MCREFLMFSKLKFPVKNIWINICKYIYCNLAVHTIEFFSNVSIHVFNIFSNTIKKML